MPPSTRFSLHAHIPKPNHCLPVLVADFSGKALLDGVEPYNVHAKSYSRRLSPNQAVQPRGERTHSVPRSRPPSMNSGAMQPVRRNPMALQQQPPNGKWLQQHADMSEMPVPSTAPLESLQPPAKQPPRPTPTPVARTLRQPPAQQHSNRQGPLPWQIAPTAPDTALPASPSMHTSEGVKPAKGLAHRRTAAAAAAQTSQQPAAGSSSVFQLASKLSLADLRRLAENKGLPSYGTKAQLAARLVAHRIQERAD